jgi:hypothetical protein
MEMWYFWVCNKVAQDAYHVKWHPGQEKLADYQSKRHIEAHHQAVCPWYLHNKNLPLVLQGATQPSTLKGCVGTLPAGYVHNVPLPRAPRPQRARTQQVHMIPDYYNGTYVDPMQDSPCSIVERAAFAFSPAWHAIAINN